MENAQERSERIARIVADFNAGFGPVAVEIARERAIYYADELAAGRTQFTSDEAQEIASMLRTYVILSKNQDQVAQKVHEIEVAVRDLAAQRQTQLR